jgi:hypothetical protein
MTRPRRLALASIDPVWEDPSGDFAPFTYGVRKLEASIRACPELDDVEIEIVDLRSRDPEAFFERIVEFQPTVVGASLYLWSIGPFSELASRLRQWNPELSILAGGPHARQSVFSLPPYRSLAKSLDAAVTSEGEQILRDILVAMGEGEDWRATPGLLVPHALGWRNTGEAPRVDIEAYPTP